MHFVFVRGSEVNLVQQGSCLELGKKTLFLLAVAINFSFSLMVEGYTFARL